MLTLIKDCLEEYKETGKIFYFSRLVRGSLYKNLIINPFFSDLETLLKVKYNYKFPYDLFVKGAIDFQDDKGFVKQASDLHIKFIMKDYPCIDYHPWIPYISPKDGTSHSPQEQIIGYG